MTDPLITQAEAIIRAAIDDPTAPPAVVAWQAANAIVEAGWTGPPGGFVVEQAAGVLIRHCSIPRGYDPPRGDHRCPACGTTEISGPNSPSHAEHQARALADAGLLRTQPYAVTPRVCTACRDGESPCPTCSGADYGEGR